MPVTPSVLSACLMVIHTGGSKPAKSPDPTHLPYHQGNRSVLPLLLPNKGRKSAFRNLKAKTMNRFTDRKCLWASGKTQDSKCFNSFRNQKRRKKNTVWTVWANNPDCTFTDCRANIAQRERFSFSFLSAANHKTGPCHRHKGLLEIGAVTDVVL